MTKTLVQEQLLPLAIAQLLPHQFFTDPIEFVWLDLDYGTQQGIRESLTPLVPLPRVKGDLKSIWQWLEGIQETINTHLVLKHRVLVLVGTLPNRTNTPDCWALTRVQFLLRDLERRGEALGYCLVDIKTAMPVQRRSLFNWL